MAKCSQWTYVIANTYIICNWWWLHMQQETFALDELIHSCYSNGFNEEWARRSSFIPMPWHWGGHAELQIRHRRRAWHQMKICSHLGCVFRRRSQVYRSIITIWICMSIGWEGRGFFKLGWICYRSCFFAITNLNNNDNNNLRTWFNWRNWRNRE